MGRGLPRRNIPVFVGQGIDTKINPALMPAGELLEVENMFYQQTGKLQLRNGFAKQPITSVRTLGTGENLFATPQGGLMAIARNSNSGNVKWPLALKYGSGTFSGWDPSLLTSWVTSPASSLPYPSFVASLAGIASNANPGNLAAADLFDCDSCAAGGLFLTGWVQATAGAQNGSYVIKDIATKKTVASTTVTSNNLTQPFVCAAGGSSYLCVFYANTAGPPSLMVQVTTVSSPQFPIQYTVALNGLNAGQPWFDAKPIPGGNLIAVAYRANAGGVTCAIVDPATGTVSSSVNTAAADASFCLGFLDDSLSTGNMYVATAGNAAGVVVRTMSATTMVVSATNVIDNTATANIRNITGHINTSSTNYVVLWDVTGTQTFYDRIKAGRWTGSSAVAEQIPHHSLFGRSFKSPIDGLYYVVASYTSTTQPTLGVFGTDAYGQVAQNGTTWQCTIASGEGPGRRVAQCSLSSPWINGNTVNIAISRRIKLTVASLTASQGRAIQLATFSYLGTAMSRPSELGGTLFLPGGIINRDDGGSNDNSAHPLAPEAPTSIASAAAGGMTASGAYSYRDVFKLVDATGRILRSAGSVPATVTLGAGDGQTTLTCPQPRIPASLDAIVVVEHYRAGPAGAGAVNYNKVGESYPNIGGADSYTFNDTMSDANAYLGELLYSTGGILESFVPPSCSVLTVCSNRVWIVNAEDPTEIWPSLEYKNRVGIRFNPLLAFKVTGDGAGGVTALAAMDGRVIAFKGTAIYVISGNGPNDAGAGSFNPPQAISLTVGTLLPRSVVATKDGIMFQAATGIWLLDRGLGLTYIGAAVEQYTLAANVVDASLVNGYTQVRFVMANGRCLVWDFFQQKWTTFLLRVGASTITACANVPGDAWYYLLADGTLMKETPGVYSDVNGSSTAIVPRVALPPLQFAKMMGFQRVDGCEILGEYVGDHTLAVDVEYDLSGVVSETRTKAITAGTGNQFQWQALFANQKSNAIKLTLRTSVQAAGSGAFRLTGINFQVAVKVGTNIPYTKRLS